ncbi:MAG TPA: CBS domain-containing protein [Solirubrobacteraceae bacterium]|jgi:CBS domain-containing protein|nr:CBS domain-containing protein [Solirubrobacteraceae bacterium]
MSTTPLVIAASAAYGLSVLVLKRSVLTEKIARRDMHVTREYSIDPLEILFLRDVMQTDVIYFRVDTDVADVAASFVADQRELRDDLHMQRVYPVLDADGRLVG